jgi:outer membrane protein with beta-barrel domain
MIMRKTRGQLWILSMAAMFVWLTSSPARADGLIVPFVGADFGGDAGSCEGITPCESKQLTWGIGVSFMVGGVIGFEGEFAHAPRFFGEGSARADNYVMTFMGNVLVGVPLGPVRPYAVGGLGVIHTDINESSVGAYNAFSNNSLGMSVGGGLIGLFSQHVGLRGDLRYLRTLEDITFPSFQLESKSLDFWRGSIGMVLRF